MIEVLVLLLITLTFKHLVVDFFLQPPWMYKNKGTFAHMGGIAHSGLHSITTFAILLFFVNPLFAAVLVTGEFLVHYVMDYTKINVNKANGWTATTHEQFWYMVGIDQTVHFLSYIAIAAIAIGF